LCTLYNVKIENNIESIVEDITAKFSHERVIFIYLHHKTLRKLQNILSSEKQYEAFIFKNYYNVSLWFNEGGLVDNTVKKE
jgi:hypothetical protein